MKGFEMISKIDPKWLREQHVDLRRTMVDIADELKCSTSTVKRALQLNGIEVRRPGSPTHGHYRARGGTGSPEYKAHMGIILRCTNPNASGWKNYGGRGIAICAGWRMSFETFLADMGQKPADPLSWKGKKPYWSIDRIDVNGHYSCGHCEHCLAEGWPANCRWATDEQQRSNTRKSVR